jgi:hypothetical protein
VVERDRRGCRRVVGYHQWHPDFELLEVSSPSDIEEKGRQEWQWGWRGGRKVSWGSLFGGSQSSSSLHQWGVANFDYVKNRLVWFVKQLLVGLQLILGRGEFKKGFSNSWWPPEMLVFMFTIWNLFLVRSIKSSLISRVVVAQISNMSIEILWLKKISNGLWFIIRNPIRVNPIVMQFIRVVFWLARTEFQWVIVTCLLLLFVILFLMALVYLVWIIGRIILQFLRNLAMWIIVFKFWKVSSLLIQLLMTLILPLSPFVESVSGLFL